MEKRLDRKPLAGLFGGARLARLIFFSVLALAPLIVANRTHAQTAPSAYGNHQTPINIIDTAVTYDPTAPTFGDTSSLMSELTFSLTAYSLRWKCISCSQKTGQISVVKVGC